MKKPKISIVIPVYKPEKEVFERLKDALKKQTLKAEVIENWDMPEAISINTGIKKAKGDIIVTLAQDCIPEDEFWLERLIKPLEDKKVVGVSSDLHLPEWYWKKYDFLTRMFTIQDIKDKRPGMDMRGCAFRKKDLINIGLINEDPKVIGIDADIHVKLSKIGKFAHPNVKVLHLHKSESSKIVLKKIYIYSEGGGKFVKSGGFTLADNWIRIIKALPFFGIVFFLVSFPFKKYYYLFPFYTIVVIPQLHIANVVGFWKGFFYNKESIRNLEVLRNKKN
jgi:glycosyltransferase involved in cell wall biosynthesis